MDSMNTPLLLLAWRRPNTLRQVIDAIRPVAPTRLFVACDGPNPDRSGETEQVAATRALIDNEIDWPCSVEKLYSDVNQGCRLGVTRSLNWFFEHVEEGIVLEDDCLPHPDFFRYCAEMLERYRQDERVFLVSGHNKEGISSSGSDYFFSRLGGIWGWASWRRAWQENRVSLKMIEEARELCTLENIVSPSIAEERYTRCIDSLTGRLDSWAYPWGFCRLVNSGLSCVPRFSLISNIGNDSLSTHTAGMIVNHLSHERFAFPLIPPAFVVPSSAYDSLYTPDAPNLLKQILGKIKVLTKSVLENRG